MLIYCIKFNSEAKANLLDAARWIRKAAMQGCMDAQHELGEMFRHGVFCDHIYMRLARKYTRCAAVQGHVEAIVRVKKLRSCVMCGADDAKPACSLCHRARYCDSRCSEKYWCEGGGVGGGPVV
jgi:TPR repeat protein